MYKKIDKNTQSGLWTITSIRAEDTFQNLKYINNMDNDLSKAAFSVYPNTEFVDVQALSGITAFSINIDIGNRIIEGDVYIGPNAFVNFNNVTVTGNIYVLGVLRASTVSAAELHASRILTGSYSNVMGTTMLSGNISIPKRVASNYVIEEIPYQLQENPIQCIDGVL